MTTDVLIVIAAAVVQDGRLLVVSKQAAPDVFYLPGGKPEPGEAPLETLAREMHEELGVTPYKPKFLATVENQAALENQWMQMTVYAVELQQVPQPAAELADLRWITSEDGLNVAPAVREQVLPLLRDGLAS
ncbi:MULTISPECIES: NUDIX domain-containing protein [Kribbella]|uniref:8-oxo-dGTP diphosphatase n=1 Tax=Kribbella pratensis TaxID=2512112 RepID=A0ABY2FGI7_9ACTN|nr:MULTISPECIES: NUDIX domain-containing protein [Kribbella]TDW90485.1 8-oxo-dGTP diphosphatase [Kribbella pratensis]TDW98222.1 8-oxo-dGTP diphosphatase [Kribbella sp. VKM Ac-2566]